MLFKKSKGPIISLGLGPPPPVERVPEKQATPAAPPEPAAAPPEAEEIQPVALLYPHTPPLPHKPPVLPPEPSDEAPVPSAPAPEPAPGEAEEAGGFLASEPAAAHTQCPYCLALTPAGKERCDHCGNRLGETGALAPGAAVAPAPAPPAEPSPPAGLPPSEEEKDLLVPLEPETRKLTTKPTPTVLKETTIFTPAQLTLLDDPRKATGQVFTLKIGQTRIGRGQDNDLPFPEEEFISRHHCEIGYHKYQYVLKDHQSANGSYVNDVRVKETILRDGDTIQIGSLRFLFEDPLEKMKKKKAEAGADRE
jgi:hypothetical protein